MTSDIPNRFLPFTVIIVLFVIVVALVSTATLKALENTAVRDTDDTEQEASPAQECTDTI